MLENLTPGTRQYPCKIRTILQELSDADRKVLVEALESPLWNNSALTTALNERGLKVSRYSVDSHTGKRCSCWRI
jgi:hypothetical protein